MQTFGRDKNFTVGKVTKRIEQVEASITRYLAALDRAGTLKAWMGSTHFLTRTLEMVKTEMSLQVLAYNMKRLINIFGVKPLMKAIAA